MNKSKHSIFDTLIGELLTYGANEEQSVIDILFARDSKAISSVPLRYRIVGLGFVKGLTLSEVNYKLASNGCEKLYGRSIYEASLMHAFNSGLSYEEWKELFRECDEIRSQMSASEYLSGKTVSLNDIEEYVQDNSDIVGNVFKTQHLTSRINESIAEIPEERASFLDFMIKNIQSFALSRECTRYYFCKYLLYYLETRRDRFLEALDYRMSASRDEQIARQRLGNASDALTVFRARVQLTRKKHSHDEAFSLINESAISLSEIYDAFQQFYFDYTSIDWMTVLLEHYGDLESLTSSQKHALADSIRRNRASVKTLSDEEIIKWQQDELEKKETAEDEKYSADNIKTPAASRTGETFLRKVIRGEVDLDRTTLLAFLLFFDSDSNVPANQRISQKRLNEILINCGFPSLNDDEPFDAFLADYMTADDPMVFLIEEAEIMAMSEENFYLYRTYLSTKDNDKELASLLSE